MNSPASVVFSIFVVTALWVGAVAAETPAKAFAKVGDRIVTLDEFSSAYESARRKHYYHGAPRADQLQDFRREVAEDLITRVLLLQEARRQGLNPDGRTIEETLKQYDQRYATNPKWKQERERWLPLIRSHAEEEDLLRQLEARARRIEPPANDELLAYYRANPQKFAEPPRARVSLILLAVDPSAPAATWQAAREEAEKLVADLRRGADFAELARLRSGDAATSQRGGDMGYPARGYAQPAGRASGRQARPWGGCQSGHGARRRRHLSPGRAPAARRNTFTEARARVRSGVRNRATTPRQALQRRLREMTVIEVYDAALRPLLFKQRRKS
ncbi:MAG: SurA N-terminal domain-containing protein [Gammaproteobacteria bacterium]